MKSASAYGYAQDQRLRLSIIIIQLIAGVIYIGSQISLCIPSRLSALSSQSSIDYFPNYIAFAVNAGLTTIWLVIWLVYAFRNSKQAQPNPIIFQTNLPKHAFILPVGMLITTVSDQMLPFIAKNKVDPWVGFGISLIGLVFLFWSMFSTIPEVTKPTPETLSVQFRLMVKSLPASVGLWSFAIFGFWLLEVVDIYTPPDLSSMVTPTPPPHEKMATQVAGVAIMAFVTGFCIFFESFDRTYFGALAPMVLLIFVAVNKNVSWIAALICVCVLALGTLIIALITEFVCMPHLKIRAAGEKIFVI